MTFTILGDFFVAGILGVMLNAIHNEQGAYWDDTYDQASFIWLCIVTLYNAYLIYLMLKAGSLFNPGIFLDNSKGGSEASIGGVPVTDGYSDDINESHSQQAPAHDVPVIANPLFDPSFDDGRTSTEFSASRELRPTVWSQPETESGDTMDLDDMLASVATTPAEPANDSESLPLDLPANTKVSLVGLKAAEFNGLAATILSTDQVAKRYVCRIDEGPPKGTIKKLKAENIWPFADQEAR